MKPALLVGCLVLIALCHPLSLIRDWGGETEIAFEIGNERTREWREKVAVPKNKSVGLCTHSGRSFLYNGNHTRHLLAFTLPHTC